MKVRLRGQSIRFRLLRPEVADLTVGRDVVSQTIFSPGKSLTFVLRKSMTADQLEITDDGDTLLFNLPADQANELAKDDVVGFDADLPVVGDRMLRVLIEKDFKCIDNANEPQDDAYPNPSAVC